MGDDVIDDARATRGGAAGNSDEDEDEEEDEEDEDEDEDEDDVGVSERALRPPAREPSPRKR